MRRWGGVANRWYSCSNIKWRDAARCWIANVNFFGWLCFLVVWLVVWVDYYLVYLPNWWRNLGTARWRDVELVVEKDGWWWSWLDSMGRNLFWYNDLGRLLGRSFTSRRNKWSFSLSISLPSSIGRVFITVLWVGGKKEARNILVGVW